MQGLLLDQQHDGSGDSGLEVKRDHFLAQAELKLWISSPNEPEPIKKSLELFTKNTKIQAWAYFELFWKLSSFSSSPGSFHLLDTLRPFNLQTGGRVGFFLETDNFERDYAAMKAKGVNFLEEPRYETYGSVVIFKDLVRLLLRIRQLIFYQTIS